MIMKKIIKIKNLKSMSIKHLNQEGIIQMIMIYLLLIIMKKDLKKVMDTSQR